MNGLPDDDDLDYEPNLDDEHDPFDPYGVGGAFGEPDDDEIERWHQAQSERLEQEEREREEIERYLDCRQPAVHVSNAASGSAGGSKKHARLSVADAEDKLIKLRNRIYSTMKDNQPNFEGYHNLLQRPLINAALESQCSSLDSFQSLGEYKRRIVNESRYPEGFESAQIDQFGKAIDSLLRSID